MSTAPFTIGAEHYDLTRHQRCEVRRFYRRRRAFGVDRHQARGMARWKAGQLAYRQRPGRWVAR